MIGYLTETTTCVVVKPLCSVDYRRRGRVILERPHRLVSCQLNYKLSVKMTSQDFFKKKHHFFPFFCHYSSPFFLTHPAQIGINLCNLIIMRDIIHTKKPLRFREF